MEFIEFPKIARLSRNIIITEKIDGTNGCIFIGEDNEFLFGSRSRWITPEQDNHGFAKWAYEHKEELIAGLGAGRHFGEWWGSGIQRGYDLPKGWKRFSLINAIRWAMIGSELQRIPCGDPRIEKWQQYAPECCHVVPVLFRGLFDTKDINSVLWELNRTGSKANPGFMKPEGVVVFHIAGNVGFKKTIEKDNEPKSKEII